MFCHAASEKTLSGLQNAFGNPLSSCQIKIKAVIVSSNVKTFRWDTRKTQIFVAKSVTRNFFAKKRAPF